MTLILKRLSDGQIHHFHKYAFLLLFKKIKVRNIFQAAIAQLGSWVSEDFEAAVRFLSLFFLVIYSNVSSDLRSCVVASPD